MLAFEMLFYKYAILGDIVDGMVYTSVYIYIYIIS